MATVSHPTSTRINVTRTRTEPLLRLWAVPLGRFLFSLIFIFSGFNHFKPDMIAYAAGNGVPMANILVPLSGLMILVGGLSVLLGYYARIGAALIIAFLVPVTLIMHNFWAISDPQMAQIQMAMFMKNVAMLGGAILIAFYGAGPVSLDHKRPIR